ncbi:MAG: AFG1 family ATPase [Gammaproteobacteria bacterium]|nr:AFG1 family ATPase [Gammaproteobacteria bacterium]
MTTPRESYRELCSGSDFLRDPAQEAAVERLQRLHEELLVATAARPSLWQRLRRQPVTRIVPGLYLWGGVGRGKTMLVDLFFATLPLPHKRRVHFHRFMRETHAALRDLPEQPDPLLLLAAQLATSCRVLCLDEFHVGDIADAMILGGLFEGLFAAGVTVIATSNEPPDNLYAGGLQRARFLPAIEAIKRHMAVVELASATDYRLRALQHAEIYHAPLDAAAHDSLLETFAELAPRDRSPSAEPIEIEGRPIPVVLRTEGVIWFEFDVLCGGPRAAGDYIEIARGHHTVLLSGVRRFGEVDDDAARRFINLIDEFYDRNVTLICSAEVAPAALYGGTRLRPSFQRTVSRLIEMQSHEYLAQPHLSD